MAWGEATGGWQTRAARKDRPDKAGLGPLAGPEVALLGRTGVASLGRTQLIRTSRSGWSCLAELQVAFIRRAVTARRELPDEARPLTRAWIRIGYQRKTGGLDVTRWHEGREHRRIPSPTTVCLISGTVQCNT